MMMTHDEYNAEVRRRRELLKRHIGETVRTKAKSKARKVGERGVLLDVKRTRALIDFDGCEWFVPMMMIQLPGSVEPDPRQLAMF